MNTNISNLVRNLKISVIVLVVSLASLVCVGQKENVVVGWRPALHISEGENVRIVPNLDNAIYQDGLPFFSKQFNLKDGKYQLSISNIISEPAHNEDINLIQYDQLVVPDFPDIRTSQAEDKKGVQVQASCVPYFKENGQIRRILSFDFDMQYIGALNRAHEKDYAANSVLSDGTWYKISVTQDGVYKMDKSFLQSLGIDVASLNPQHINIYGNSFGLLNEANNAAYVDDLIKNSIVVVGESDGTFDEADYIMFYAAGPNRWDLSGGLFSRKQHLYSEESVYFIHIDETDAPLRVETLNNNDNPINQTVTSYSYYAIHEYENTNLVKGGQRWYGELFDAELSQNFSFNVPNISSSTATVRYAVANNGVSGNNFTVYYNSSLVNTLNLSSGGNDFARNSSSFTFTPTSANVSLNYVFTRTNASVKGYLDYIDLNCRRSLSMTGSQMRFEDLNSVGLGNISQFVLSNVTTDYSIWEISNPTNPMSVNATFLNGELRFTQATDTLRRFFAFKNTNLLVPDAIGAVPNQNLHALPQIDYVILTHKNFLAEASRLAALHQANGLDVAVVTTEEVYNEFSSGMQDATAIKRFMKMFYDRAAGDVNLQPQSLLLFGDGTYDPKNRLSGNNNYVVTYQFANSENHIAAMVCDDYFGILADNGAMAGSDLMQISVGRILVSSTTMAKEQVDKIEHYMKNGSQLFSGSANECCMDQSGTTFGDWRNNYVLITDDEENGYFVNIDAEPVSDEVYGFNPELNVDKIYSDAYMQTSTAGGARYPEVYDAISNRVERGSLLLNYIGHGGEVGAAEERIITIPQIQSWDNINKLNCFVTATCEFTRFDDPSRVSAGEWIQLNPTGGAIALMTTTRSVTFTVNTATVETFYEHVFSRDANFEPLTFGEIMRRTKNNSGIGDNRRSFMLLGDPELKIALPRYKIVVDSINHLDPSIEMDTIKALSVASIAGHFEDYNGNVLSSLNGVLTPTVFDKPKQTQTLGNDSGSPVIPFKTQRNAIYKGQATVTNGQFNFDFFVPKDIVYAYGKGKISLYGASTTTDANGLDTNFYVGGINTSAPMDNVGPEVELYMNDKNFVNGGITSSSPLLVVEASDEFGINTVGNGIGHDLLAIIDGETANPIVLNDYYVGDLDSYKSGKIKYNLPTLEAGKHYIEVKIWDSNNNSSTARIDFEVREEENVELSHVLNYPNPFTTNTTFFFEHNQSCSNLETQIQIYTVTGKLVKTINENVPTAGFRVEGISWDGKDEYGDPLAKGVYVYRVTVELATGETASKTEKLFLLK
jgi:hypothetical protein